MVPYASLLGYKKGEEGNLAIDETQAPIVQRIYARFLEGATHQTIAKELTADQIPTPRGKQIWSPSTVQSILTNEKYKGDALLQKSFTTNFLNKTMKVNEGEVPQYYVTGNHEPIITPVTWGVVQAELTRRAGKDTSNTHPLCQQDHLQRVWWLVREESVALHQQIPPLYLALQQQIQENPSLRDTHVTEEQIKNPFVAALAERVTNTDVLDDTMCLLDETVYDTRELETQQATLGERIEETITLMN